VEGKHAQILTLYRTLCLGGGADGLGAKEYDQVVGHWKRYQVSKDRDHLLPFTLPRPVTCGEVLNRPGHSLAAKVQPCKAIWRHNDPSGYAFQAGAYLTTKERPIND